jgi:4-aminobutyrate aminotransferase-like enzyme
MPFPTHANEPESNRIRQRAGLVEPACLRTFSPSAAVLAKSAGCYHWTPEGRKLADLSSGVLVANLGHNPASWWRRVVQYLGIENLPAQSGSYHASAPLTSYNALTELDVAASERLVELLRGQPGGERMEQVLWAASGSEAIQKALWAALARRPGADIMLATRAGFHGKKGLAGAITGTEKDADRDPRVRFISFPREECIDVSRRREPIDLEPYCRELDAAWNEYGARISCLCTEPYLGGGGSYHPQPEYLQLLQSFCREHDIVFILDEIQSNFGRTGPLFAFTAYGVTPDIVVLGKGLGNGVPVSAAVGPASVFASLNYGEGSDTWSANPLSSAAVLATLDEFASSDVIQHAEHLSKAIEAGLLRLKELPGVAYVRGEGMVWGVECAAYGQRTADEIAKEYVLASYLGDAQGRALHILGPLAGRVLRVSPPLVWPLEEAREYLDAMYGIFASVTPPISR